MHATLPGTVQYISTSLWTVHTCNVPAVQGRMDAVFLSIIVAPKKAQGSL